MRNPLRHPGTADAASTPLAPNAIGGGAHAAKAALFHSRGRAAPAGRIARERRAKARASLSRAKRREEVLGEVFDFLNGRDVLRVLLCLGAAEVRGGAEIGVILTPVPVAVPGSAVAGALAGLVFATGQICVGLALWSLLKFLSLLGARVRRPVYYPRERIRRQRLAKERRRVRDRFTVGGCPKPGELLKQYAKARTDAREALRFGSMLCDLEAYCDNSLVRNVDGEIIGRNPGVKGWIRMNCHDLLPHYKNAMRYKGIAEKFRQAVGAADPVPAEMLSSPDSEALEKLLGGRRSRKITVRMQKANGDRCGEVASETYTLEAAAVEAVRRRAQELLAECETGGNESTDKDRLRCGSNVQNEGGAQKGKGARGGGGEPEARGARRGNGARGSGEALEARGARRVSVAALVAALDERLAPEFAPSGWKLDSVAPNRRGLA